MKLRNKKPVIARTIKKSPSHKENYSLNQMPKRRLQPTKKTKKTEPEPMMEQFNTSGNDVHIGRFLAHMDSWYERNLMIAAHHLLRLLPAVSACTVVTIVLYLH